MRATLLFSAMITACLSGPPTMAGEDGPPPKEKVPVAENVWSIWTDRECPAEKLTASVMSGFYYTSTLGTDVQDMDYVPFDLRLGWRPWYDREDLDEWQRVQLLLDLKAAPITSGPGSILAGPSVLFRYDLRDPHRAVLPYFQLGAGIAFTDGDEDETQRAVRSSAEFMMEAQLGLRWRVRENLSIDIEGGVQHISNASGADRNGGVSAYGISIGFTHSFR